MTVVCSGCREQVANEDDVLVEVASTVVRVDRLGFLALRMRTRLYGPYCDQGCWRLDSGDEPWPGVAEDLRGDRMTEFLSGAE